MKKLRKVEDDEESKRCSSVKRKTRRLGQEFCANIPRAMKIGRWVKDGFLKVFAIAEEI